MDKKFSQKDFLFNRKHFTLKEDGLHLVYKSLIKSSEVFVKYENIGTKIIINKSGKKGWLIATGVLLALSLSLYIDNKFSGNVERSFEAFYFGISMSCLLVYLLTFKQSLHLTKDDNTNSIEFLLNNPSKTHLDDFLLELKNKKKEVLLEKYGGLNKNISYEKQYENLNWLRHNNALNSEEHKQKIKELDDLFVQNRAIGFNSSNN
ncbi:hypothetical protein [Algoriphagus winogradskyi]|uniref:SMODS and SLOG-associating 2TM effector domain-containing protein n=1 Tax=Algoriphagus winogradskyi TaxID=237017 RepID=A0ABY1N8U3_9BACT|nr:hypothetical protein [Algoriphagus winogradskyi]SMP03523.1 hypothetical protein SAMN06265367_101185 [Algoriphagus winogradskyi]